MIFYLLYVEIPHIIMHFIFLSILSFFQFIDPFQQIWFFLVIRLDILNVQAIFPHELSICNFWLLEFFIFIGDHIIVFFESSLGCAISGPKRRLPIEHLMALFATHRGIRLILNTLLWVAIVLDNLQVGTFIV